MSTYRGVETEFRSQIQTLLSIDPVASRFISFEKPTDVTDSVCAAKEERI